MLILYTKNNCSYCEKVKEAFLQSSVVYEERNIENLEYLEEAKSKGPHRSRRLRARVLFAQALA